jgi:hypothetical protein
MPIIQFVGRSLAGAMQIRRAEKHHFIWRHLPDSFALPTAQTRAMGNIQSLEKFVLYLLFSARFYIVGCPLVRWLPYCGMAVLVSEARSRSHSRRFAGLAILAVLPEILNASAIPSMATVFPSQIAIKSRYDSPSTARVSGVQAPTMSAVHAPPNHVAAIVIIVRIAIPVWIVDVRITVITAVAVVIRSVEAVA